jgi:hypothetical protein
MALVAPPSRTVVPETPSADGVFERRRELLRQKVEGMDWAMQAAIRPFALFSQPLAAALRATNVDGQPMLTEQQFQDILGGFERLTSKIDELKVDVLDELEKLFALTGQSMPVNLRQDFTRTQGKDPT